MIQAPRPLRRFLKAGLAIMLGLAGIAGAQAQKKYDPGASDTEIKIGNILPYSGPASAYGTIGKAMTGYFAKVNAEGGINGRKINFVSLDDAYTPSRTVEQARKLVEQEQVLLLFGTLGTAQNMAIQRYLNTKKVPQLFVATGATRFGDLKAFPWTLGWQPTYQSEGQIYAQHILKNKPDAKIAILMQNDDFGRDYLKGFLDGLGGKAKTMVVDQVTYEIADPTVDSQLVKLKSSGADTFFSITTPKFAAQAIRKVVEINWRPTLYQASVSSSVPSVLTPAGLDNAKGVITAQYFRQLPEDSKETADYMAMMAKYYPGGNPNESLNVQGYSMAQTLEAVLRAAGDDLTRANIMKIAANLSLRLPMLYPGIEIKTGPNDSYPIEKMQPLQFDGKRLVPLGPMLGK